MRTLEKGMSRAYSWASSVGLIVCISGSPDCSHTTRKSCPPSAAKIPSYMRVEMNITTWSENVWDTYGVFVYLQVAMGGPIDNYLGSRCKLSHVHCKYASTCLCAPHARAPPWLISLRGREVGVV